MRAFACQILPYQILFCDLSLHATVLGRMKTHDRLRNAEVQEARHPIPTDDDVLWRDVAMHDMKRISSLVGRVVRRLQSRQDIEHDRGRNGWRWTNLHR